MLARRRFIEAAPEGLTREDALEATRARHEAEVHAAAAELGGATPPPARIAEDLDGVPF